MLSHVMASSTAHNTLLFISYFFLGFTLQHCSARDTITPETPINSTSGETLISAGKIFELGFFTRTRPDSSTNNTYVGIWYYNLSPPKMIVWVANRDNPLTNFGILKVEDGNLVLSGENGCFINISTGVSVSTNSHTKGKLLDSGNLVLTRPGKLLWQSFDHPTDTFLPGMVMTQSLRLTSWRSPDDPGTGNFTFRQDDNQTTVIWKRDKKYWVSREWGESASYSYMNTKVECLVLNFNTINTTTTATTGAHYISYNTIRTNSCVFDYTYLRLVMDSSGELQFWNISGDSRHKQWFAPEDRLCSLYNFCGDFGICNRQSNSPCKCLMPTFEPCSPDNWKSGDFSDGCKRKSVSAFSEKDEFNYLPTVRVAPPAVNLMLDNETECLSQCLMDSTCQAYSYTEDTQQKRVTEEPYKGRTCWFWIYDLQNLVENATQEGRDLYVRNPSQDPGDNPQVSDHSNKKDKSISLRQAIVYMGLFVTAVLLCSISYSLYRERMLARRRESRGRRTRESSQAPGLYDTEGRVRNLIDSGEFKEEDRKDIDVPFFDLQVILEATDFFSDEHKLGQGGFGPVYKGKFPGGKEIAVKRLSIHSGQGLEEFKNEIVLIAKLQHRNLVRLLGYCIVGNEKILLYEYMPNKSLDMFIFDRTRCLTLDWEKRFNIIFGIARGLLYLHHDSRLRIIHRDLKTSNILLDEEMNPKISDFGLARIVAGKEVEANTNKVVGTYGYISPEYALDGLFSIKSDVYSFGVIILEIISGKRNTRFYQSQQAQNLPSYAWTLWREEKPLDLMDRSLLSSCNEGEVLKCITIGLLCVQEDPNDRPTMSKALFMLGSETASLPNPQEPAFLVKMRSSSSPSSSSTKLESLSINDITNSTQDAR